MKRIYLLDMLERTLWTFLQAFCAVWIVTGDFTVDALKVATAAGVIAVAKAIAARQIGDGNSAATLPSPPDHAPGE